MANLRAIRTRIKSVENTRQITKSMKMVAASKLRKTQAAFASLRAYADRSGDILKSVGGELAAKDCAGGQAGASREAPGAAASGAEIWMVPREEVRTVCYVLIVGNRGLCGTYNQALLRYCEKLIKSSDKQNYVISCGRWGKDLIAGAGVQVQETFEIGDTPTHQEALELAERLKTLYREGTVDEIVLLYQHYRTVLSQEPTQVTLLPIRQDQEISPFKSPLNIPGADSTPKKSPARSRGRGDAGGKADGGSPKTEVRDILFEPDRESVLTALLDMYIGNTVHAVLLEARCGEHSARMTAMTAAADNTEELISDLTLEMNHARQAAITTEISEIASGAEALKKTSSD